MTREEYEQLLKSDYWRGYSYSLIKERDFTCEDCGRRFYNERNKLQVHHLVYRDISPWSYRPKEVVVLCEDCHKRRHGLIPALETATDKTQESYAGSYSYGSGSKEGRIYYGKRSTDREEIETISRADNIGYHSLWQEAQPRRIRIKYILCGLLLLVAFIVGYFRTGTANDEMNPAREEHPVHPLTEIETSVILPSSTTYNSATSNQSASSKDGGASTLELLERINHAEVVKRARHAGVSTEGSTVDILERINHAEVVKQAKRAGVSTEGSTVDILERINHAEVVKQAKRAGVSAEGSTVDILDRINHAEVVKQAKRAGVSTEGSTADILERIN